QPRHSLYPPSAPPVRMVTGPRPRPRIHERPGGASREPAMLERTPPQFRELQEITMQTDTRDILAHATRQAESYEDLFLVDIDAHVTETSFWPEILASIDNEVIRQMGQAVAERPGASNIALLNSQPGTLYQHV